MTKTGIAPKAIIVARLADSTLQQPVYNDPADYNVDIYNLAIFRYEGLYVGLPAVYHSTARNRMATTPTGSISSSW